MATNEGGAGNGPAIPAAYRLGRTSIVGVTVVRPDGSTTRMVQLIFPADRGWAFNEERLVRTLGIPYDSATDEIHVDDAAQASWDVVLVD